MRYFGKFKKKGLRELSAVERAEIVEDCLVHFISHKDVAMKYRVSTSLVNQLKSKVRKDTGALQKIREKEETRQTEKKEIKRVVTEMNSANQPIWKVQQVVEAVNARTGSEVKYKHVRMVFKKDLCLHFRKVRKVTE